MKFNMVPFWIHILNVPLACMNERCARVWRDLMGTLEKVEVQENSMKVRVKTNIEKPLQRGLRLFMEEIGQEVFVSIQKIT